MTLEERESKSSAGNPKPPQGFFRFPLGIFLQSFFSSRHLLIFCRTLQNPLVCERKKMEKSYLPLCAHSNSNGFDEETSFRDPGHSRKSYSISCYAYAILFLLCTNILTFLYKFPADKMASRVPDNYGWLRINPRRVTGTQEPLTFIAARVEPLPEIYTPFHWWTAYGSHNHTRDDQLWKAINPSHGFVAIDRQAAEDQHLPVAMYLPSDGTKGVYLLEAYHQLHCLVCVERCFKEIVNKRSRKRSARAFGKRLRTGSTRTRQAIWSIVLTHCDR